MCEDKINVRVKGELPRTAEAESGRERERRRAALLLNCCSRCSVAELQRERESVRNAHALQSNNKKNLPVQFMASIAWRMRCDWAKSTPYLKITHSAARSHLTCATPSTRTHSTHTALCAALPTGSVTERAQESVRQTRAQPTTRARESKSATEASRTQPNCAERSLCASLRG